MDFNRVLAGMLAVIIASSAFGQDGASNGPWSGNVSLGYISSEGNTESSSGTFEFGVGYNVNAWNHGINGRAFGSSQDGATTAENYKLTWKSTYDFNDRNYAFGEADYNKNRFSGYPRQIFAIVGYGRRVLNSEVFELNLEAGAGYADQKQEIAPGVLADEDGAVGRLSGDFTWNFSETASFVQTLSVSAASANTYWESVSKVSASLVGSLALAVSYTIQANSDVAPDLEKTDRFTAVSLEYSFGE